MNFTISNVDVRPLENGNTDVIYNVHWRVSKTTGDNTASAYGTQSLEAPSEAFTAFENVTTATVITWVEAAMGTEALTSLEDSLDTQIDLIANPTSISKQLLG
tara:strand:+ start:126 stop:434 length:309 start_codon:yes stop_codon:yes gene_type:complete